MSPPYPRVPFRCPLGPSTSQEPHKYWFFLVFVLIFFSRGTCPNVGRGIFFLTSKIFLVDEEVLGYRTIGSKIFFHSG